MAVKIEHTDSRAIIDGKSCPDIPLLVDATHRFIEPVCTYLRHLVIGTRIKTSSVCTYAEGLQVFCNFLERHQIALSEVTDAHFRRWLNWQEKSGVCAGTQASRCDAVFKFYVWMEEHGYVTQMVRVPGVNDSSTFIPNLSSVPAKNSRRGTRKSSFGIISAIRPKVGPKPRQATPTSEDVSRIYIAADSAHNADIVERNHLLIDWYVQVGLRRMEWCALTVAQIPDWDTIYSLQQKGEVYELPLHVTKGDRPRHVGVLPDLLEKTREYIEGAREDVIVRFRRKQHGQYLVPSEVFLSNKTGLALNTTAVTNLASSWFKAAGVEGHGHRLRATYLTSLFEAEIAAEFAKIASFPGTKRSIDYELVLLKVAERAGHADIESLRPYLTLARKRIARSGSDKDLVTLQQMIDAKTRELKILESQISAKQTALAQLK